MHLVVKREMRNAAGILFVKPEERGHLGDVGLHGMIILKWILKY
jgi:hypothetical protein